MRIAATATSHVLDGRPSAPGLITVLLLAILQGPAMSQPVGDPSMRPVGTGVLRGRVVDAANGTPVPRVTVTASLWRPSVGATSQGGASAGPAPRMLSRTANYAARTTADGSFQIAALPAGTFSVSVQREGFSGRGLHRMQEVSLSEGGTMVIPDITVPTGGVITGRVLDAFGEPVVRATVTPYRRQEPQHPLTLAGPAITTDDRGQYRLYGLAPGAYTVHVAPRIRRRGTLQGDARELLPGVPGGRQLTDAEYADVVAGGEATLDVRLEEGLLGSVAGQVFGEDGAPVTRAFVSVRHVDPLVQQTVGGVPVSSVGTFEVTGVPPGRYLVVAQDQHADTSGPPTRQARPLRAAWTTVVVSGQRVDGLAMTLTTGAAVRGRIDVEGGDPAQLFTRSFRLSAEPAIDGWPPVGHGEAVHDADGPGFTFAGLHGPHRFRADGLPDGWWIKSITIDGRDAFEGHEFPARGVVESALVVVSARPTGVTGRVEGAAGASGPLAAVVLVLPRDQPAVTMATRGRGHITGTAPDGTFRVGAVRPGSYVVIATGVEMLEALRDMTPDQVRALADTMGATVDVVEGQFATVTVRLAQR